MPHFSLSHRLNAREAKLLAYDAYASTLEYVHNQIYDACLKGRTVITVCAMLTPEIVHALQAEGYVVYFDRDERGHGDFWVISWQGADIE